MHSSRIDPSILNGIPNLLYCPDCKARTRINYEIALLNNDKTYFAIAKCIDCKRLTIMHCKAMPSDKEKPLGYRRTIPVNIIYTYPLVSETKTDDIPPKIVNSYLEGVRCLDANAPNGAVTMFRRSLQQICVEKGANPKDRLVDQIKVLPEQVRPTAKEIKAWGNLGAHEDSNGKIEEVNKEQADAIKRFLESVFMVVYQHPIELERLKGQRT
jgi:hypothetical protein